jgi:prevent-host-death family protein
MRAAAPQVNIHEAKTNLSRLIERVEQGEEIVIARGGRPIARLIPYTADLTPRQPGVLRGRLKVSDEFDAPLPAEVLAAFLSDT